MKKIVLLIALSAGVFTTAALAGTPTYAPGKEVAPPPPVYGLGWYGGLQLGINAYQDFGGTRRISIGNSEVAFEPREKIGFVGGLKLGYVFGDAFVRPAVEADLYYNGVQADVDARVNGHDTDFNAEAKLHSGAFMGNFLLRFSYDRFQPYFGGGIGGYYAERQSVEIKTRNREFHGDGGSNSGFAWQLVGGADYYWTEKVSTFLEYKFLNYEDAGINSDRIAQHLVVLGLRWHF